MNLSHLTARYNELLDSTWSRSKTLGKNKSKGYFKREETMNKRYEWEKAEMIRIDEERCKIGKQMMEDWGVLGSKK